MQDTLGNYLRDNLPELQSLVEDKLGVELGEIDILPLVNFPEKQMEKFGGDYNTFTRFLLTSISQLQMIILENFKGYALAWDSSIYYSQSTLALMLPERRMAEMGLHELVHLAHQKMAGKNPVEIIAPPYIIEGFADYVAWDILQETHPTPYSGHPPFTSHVMAFERELDRRHIRYYDGMIDFVVSVS